MAHENVLEILQKHQGERGALISILQEIQSQYGYLPEEALRHVASGTGRSLVDIYGVATFYRAFSLKPRGRHLCSVCVGTTCHVRGAPHVAEEFKHQLHVSAGQTTMDREFTLETVNCLGACALGPIVVVDGHYFSKVSRAKVPQILERARTGVDGVAPAGDRRIFPVEVSCPRCNHALMDAGHFIDGYPSIRVTVAFNHKHGWLRLSSLYGSYVVESEYEIAMNSVVNFFCPHCNAELMGAGNCPVCDAPVVPMIVRRGGVVQICSRRGCKYHRLDLGSNNI